MLKLYIFAALVAGGSASALVVESDAQADTFCSLIGQSPPPPATDGVTLTCTDECYGFQEKIEYDKTFTIALASLTLKFAAQAEIAPCATKAYITLSYEAGSTWTTIDTYTLPKTEKVPIPEASLGSYGGAYLDVTLSGSMTSLKLELALSICESATDATSLTCDGDILVAGPVLTAAGLPFTVFTKTFTSFSSICDANACSPPPPGASSPPGSSPSDDSGSGDSDSDSDDLALPLGLGLGLGLPVVGAASFLGYKKMKKGSLSGETPAVKMITDNQS
jgi:hypothetical protein